MRRIIRERDEKLGINMAACSLEVVAPFRGYHVYKEHWEPTIGDHITFERESGERFESLLGCCTHV